MDKKINWEEFKKNCGHRLLDISEEFYQCTIQDDGPYDYKPCCLEKDCPLLNKIK